MIAIEIQLQETLEVVKGYVAECKKGFPTFKKRRVYAYWRGQQAALERCLFLMEKERKGINCRHAIVPFEKEVAG